MGQREHWSSHDARQDLGKTGQDASCIHIFAGGCGRLIRTQDVWNELCNWSQGSKMRARMSARRFQGPWLLSWGKPKCSPVRKGTSVSANQGQHAQIGRVKNNPISERWQESVEHHQPCRCGFCICSWEQHAVGRHNCLVFQRSSSCL